MAAWVAGCDAAPPSDSAASEPLHDAATAAPSLRGRRTKVDAEIWERFSRVPSQRVIVEVDDPLGRAPRRDHASTTAAERTARIERRRIDLASRKGHVLDRLEQQTRRAATVRYAYEAFRLVALELDEEQVRVLDTLPEVTAIFVDREERAQLDESLPYCGAMWFQQNRGTGAGTSVAILDTPIRYDHAAFGTCPSVGAPGCSVVEWLSFADETAAEVIAKEDEYGKTSHGTNVAAIALGVAPETKLLGLNVFHSNDAEDAVLTYVSDQIEALDWVATHAASHDIVAVNLSVGGSHEDPWPCNYDDARYDPIRTLRTDHDILTVVSAGNAGEQDAVSTPGCLTMAVTVAAQFDTDLGDYPKSCSQPDPHVGEMACFSNLSGMVDLVAPGVNIEAADLVKNGTSQAAPHVTGAVAAWQSWFLAEDGSFKSAPWMDRRLLADSTLPMAHTDGRRFARLAMADESFHWDDAHSLPVWHREASGNLIPQQAPGFQETITVTGKGYDIAGAYLYLEVVHLHPEDVEVTLESPSGAAATVHLPDGQSHFNGIVGRHVSPGAFAALAGSPVDGTWTLSLRDTHTADQGHYIQAALFFVAEGCTPSCDDGGCGDDRCGGSCGELCEIDGACYLAGSTGPSDPCQGCVPSVTAADWSPVPGACDDGDPCTEDDACSAGACAGTPIDCPLPGACEEPGHCDSTLGECVYPRAPDGSSCDDGNLCTAIGVCQDGVCVAPPIACPAPGECQLGGICSLEARSCVYPPAPDGTECADGVCEGGICTDSCSCSAAVGHDQERSAGWWLLWAVVGLAGRGSRPRRCRR